jgi:hypothetical protein
MTGHGHRARDTFAHAHTRYPQYTTLRGWQLCAGCWTLLVGPPEASGLVSTAARAMLAALDRVFDQSCRWLCVPGCAGVATHPAQYCGRRLRMAWYPYGVVSWSHGRPRVEGRLMISGRMRKAGNGDVVTIPPREMTARGLREAQLVGFGSGAAGVAACGPATSLA